MRTKFLVVIAAAIAVNACSSDGNKGTGTGGAGGGGAGTTGSAGTTGNGGTTGGGGTGGLAACGTDTASGNGATCNTIDATGPCVVVQLSTATAPTPAGGTVSNGTYLLTSETLYGAADSGNQQEDRRETFVVSAATAAGFTLDQTTVSGTRVDRSRGAVVIAGSMVTYTPVCPAPGDGGDQGGSANFTATSTTFTLIQSKNGGTRVSVYTKS
jgi:hypothetical protein